MADRRWADIPAPAPDMVASSRRHITEHYATGVDRLLWEQEKRTMPDADAVRAVVSAAAAEKRLDVLDVGAALVLVQAMRLELDLLEADVLDVAEAGGVPDESVAAVLELPGAAAAAARRRMLSAKRELPQATREESPPARSHAAHEAAGRAGHRATSAASRANEAARRRERLRQNRYPPAAPSAPAAGQDTETASARASEARVNARDASERVALALLNAAETFGHSAEHCREQEHAAAAERERERLRRRAAEYTRTAELYREMADRYLRLGQDRT